MEPKEVLAIAIPILVYLLFLEYCARYSYKVGRKYGCRTDERIYLYRWDKRRKQLRRLHLKFLLTIIVHVAALLYFKDKIKSELLLWQVGTVASGFLLYILLRFRMYRWGEGHQGTDRNVYHSRHPRGRHMLQIKLPEITS